MKCAIIVDIDETLCTQFDVPVEIAVSILREIDERKVDVHYVTARTAVCRDATEKFIRAHSLPGDKNIHHCPSELGSLEHKRLEHLRLAREMPVLASIGDSFEEEWAAAEAGVPFIIADPLSPIEAWNSLSRRIADVGGFKLQAETS